MGNWDIRGWMLRLLKGTLIGSGFILPGVSGGALAAVFGLYERMISFVANLTKHFRENLLFFLPVGLGGLLGVFALSFAVSYFLGAYETQMLWLFVGCILGTLPALWRQAGKRGRRASHLALLAVSAGAGFLLLGLGRGVSAVQLSPNMGAWLLAGGLIGLGAVVPGLSPSNFLIYFGLYKAMADGIKNADLSVVLPLGIGAAVCVVGLSKAMDRLLSRAYPAVFHCILGVVLASTAIIVPSATDTFGPGFYGCLAACVGGIALGRWMSVLEETHLPE